MEIQDLSHVGSLLAQALGPGPVRAKDIIGWLTESKEGPCASIETNSEAQIVGALLVELELLHPMIDQERAENFEKTVKISSGVLQNDLRLFSFAKDAPQPHAAHSAENRPVQRVELTELLQLPPLIMTNRLKSIRDMILMQAGVDNHAMITGKALTDWMMASGLVANLSEAVMVGNLLVNHGCLEHVDPPTERNPLPFSETKVLLLDLKVAVMLGDVPWLKEYEDQLKGLQMTQQSDTAVKSQSAAVRDRDETALHELTKEEGYLKRLIIEEEKAFMKDKEGLMDDRRALSELEDRAKLALTANKDAHKTAADQRDEWLRHEFLVEARRVKLVSELAMIYPIVENGKNEWTIRGLELPSDLTTMDDDHVSSALGYVVHVLLMLAKYYQIPLRYQLVYYGSRSHVRDRVASSSRDNTYPLYRTRVDQSRYEQALKYLVADIEQILTTRGVAFDRTAHLLKNLGGLFLHEMCPQLQ